jgi:hypothetical protein
MLEGWREKQVTISVAQTRHNLAMRVKIATSVFICATCAAAFALATKLSANSSITEAGILSVSWPTVWGTTALALLLGVATAILRNDLARFSEADQEIRSALSASGSVSVTEHLATIERLARRTSAISVLKAQFSEQLDQHLDHLLHQEAREDRAARIEALCRRARSTLAMRIGRDRANSPIVVAHGRLVSAIANLKLHKAEAEKELDRQREAKWLKVWFDLTRPDFAEVEEKIDQLEVALDRLRKSGALEADSARFDALAARIEIRIAEIEMAGIEAIPIKRSASFNEDRILRNAMWLGAFSVPVSLWGDATRAGDVYDSLRQVNSNYAESSNFEIWLDTLTMAPAELAGLGSLAKGAYFEQLIESDFGGQRFEHFNHPDTDIVIDGTAFQVKATDSVSYIEGVPEDIPVISTTEIAEITGSIDGGYLNVDLTETVDLSLGGSVIDIGDTTVDAILTGVGGVGIFAILKGVWSGSAHYKETGNALEALSAGVSTTAVSTARTAVNAAEIVGRGTVGFFRSRPMRFAGRMMVAGGRRVDNWLEEGQPDKPRRQ